MVDRALASGDIYKASGRLEAGGSEGTRERKREREREREKYSTRRAVLCCLRMCEGGKWKANETELAVG